MASLNPTMRAYQAIQKAAADVADKKTGAKARLAAAKKRYKALVEKAAKAEMTKRIADANKKAEAAAKPKKAKAKTTKSKSKVGKTTRKKTASKTAKKRR